MASVAQKYIIYRKAFVFIFLITFSCNDKIKVISMLLNFLNKIFRINIFKLLIKFK